MTTRAVDALAKEAAHLPPEELLAVVLKRFGDRIALASSMGAEDQVITDMLSRGTDRPRIFTLDTGRLPQETYDVIEATRRKYGISIKLLFPDRDAVEAMAAESGPNLFYDSVEARRRCCHVRKVDPLKRELSTLDAWITGLRREQSVTREQVARIEWDQANGLVKVNPLTDWSADDVWKYIREHDVPYNALHDAGYPSIGCAPCTRAVGEGEDARAGRWWWEDPEQKECGLHLVDGKMVRAKK